MAWNYMLTEQLYTPAYETANLIEFMSFFVIICQMQSIETNACY